MKQYLTERYRVKLILVALFCFFLFPWQEGLTEEGPAMPPSIEELTNGKVKIGDLITKENVDLVKAYLPPGLYQCVRDGMIIRAERKSPEELPPQYYKEVSERSRQSKGKPIVDEDIVIYTKDGETWPGGLPFPERSNALEIVANMKWGDGVDDFFFYNESIFVNKEGEAYKYQLGEGWWIFCSARKILPPLPVYPGFETEHQRNIFALTEPFDLKGLGQLNIKYWNETKQPDAGFAYLPAFKRVIRISATTYQDNLGGSDLTWGDPQGIREQYNYWSYKGGEERLIFAPTLLGEKPFKNPNGRWDWKNWDEGKKYLRRSYAITPMNVVEATPKIKHLYSKKILYIHHPDFRPIYSPCAIVDIYDRRGELWKSFVTHHCLAPDLASGKEVPFQNGFTMVDLQTGHRTHFNTVYSLHHGFDPKMIDMKFLLSKGR